MDGLNILGNGFDEKRMYEELSLEYKVFDSHKRSFIIITLRPVIFATQAAYQLLTLYLDHF